MYGRVLECRGSIVIALPCWRISTSVHFFPRISPFLSYSRLPSVVSSPSPRGVHTLGLSPSSPFLVNLHALCLPSSPAPHVSTHSVTRTVFSDPALRSLCPSFSSRSLGSSSFRHSALSTVPKAEEKRIPRGVALRSFLRSSFFLLSLCHGLLSLLFSCTDSGMVPHTQHRCKPSGRSL